MSEQRTPTGMLRAEHRLILEVLDVLERIVETGQTGEWDVDSMEECVAFFRLFADACHHGKEEDLLFPELEARGMPKDSGPIAVMLFEHRQGRALVAQMAGALEGARQGETEPLSRFENAARAYIQLLRGHINKEDNVLFNMADFMFDATCSMPPVVDDCANSTMSSVRGASRGRRRRSWSGSRATLWTPTGVSR